MPSKTEFEKTLAKLDTLNDKLRSLDNEIRSVGPVGTFTPWFATGIIGVLFLVLVLSGSLWFGAHNPSTMARVNQWSRSNAEFEASIARTRAIQKATTEMIARNAEALGNESGAIPIADPVLLPPAVKNAPPESQTRFKP